MADFIPYSHPVGCDAEEAVHRTREFLRVMSGRRTVRTFSNRSVPEQVIRDAVAVAGSAPSGANRQPWHFAVVRNPDLKRRIRKAAEEEERAFYGGRAPDDWLEALEPFGTGPEKPFLERAPVLIAVFAERWGMNPDGTRVKNYYVQESVGIACGMLIAALHQAGLSTLTHTPSPMQFLGDLLGRPERERAFLLLVVGYAEDDTTVPDIPRRPLDDIASFQ